MFTQSCLIVMVKEKVSEGRVEYEHTIVTVYIPISAAAVVL